jgi:hypothetical protein
MVLLLVASKSPAGPPQLGQPELPLELDLPHHGQVPLDGLGTAGHLDQDARRGIAKVVVAARGMVDRIPATARGAALQAAQPRREPRHVEQLDPAAVQKRQHVAVDV